MDCFALLDTHTIGLIREKLPIEDRINLDDILARKIGRKPARIAREDLYAFDELIFTHDSRTTVDTIAAMLRWNEHYLFARDNARVVLCVVAYLCRPNVRENLASHHKLADVIIDKMKEFSQAEFGPSRKIENEFELKILCEECARHYRAFAS